MSNEALDENDWPEDTIAPAWRVERIDGARVTVAIRYLMGSATDYSGSAAPGYPHAAAAGEDGGTSWCRVGMRLRLHALDTTEVLTVGNLRVAAVDPGARTITLEAPPAAEPHDWAAFVAGGGMADLVFDHAPRGER